MSFKNKQAMQDFCARRANRMAEVGVGLEDTVEKVLQKLQSDGGILRFTRHPHNSTEDRSGKDFTVVFNHEDKEIEHSFGVTISNRSWQRGKVIHHDVTQFCWPVGTNTQTMEKRILGLLKKT